MGHFYRPSRETRFIDTPRGVWVQEPYMQQGCVVVPEIVAHFPRLSFPAQRVYAVTLADYTQGLFNRVLSKHWRPGK